MNFCWRIIKYNPKYRNSSGAFLHNEWTDYSDIGKIFNAEPFTYEEYVLVENLYINAIKYFMNCHKITSLQVTTLEKPTTMDLDIYDTNKMINLFNTIKENGHITENDIDDFCRLILRNKLWCKLIYNQKMFVHFGWDFYMYIGSSLACIHATSMIQKNGLFIEQFESPYQT